MVAQLEVSPVLLLEQKQRKYYSMKTVGLLYKQELTNLLMQLASLWVLEVWELILLFLQLLWILYYCSPAHIEFHGIAVLSSALFDIRYHCREVFAVLICVLSFCCPPWSQTAQLNWKVQSGRIYLSGKCSIPVCLWDWFLFLVFIVICCFVKKKAFLLGLLIRYKFFWPSIYRCLWLVA